MIDFYRACGLICRKRKLPHGRNIVIASPSADYLLRARIIGGVESVSAAIGKSGFDEQNIFEESAIFHKGKTIADLHPRLLGHSPE